MRHLLLDTSNRKHIYDETYSLMEENNPYLKDADLHQ